VDGFTALGFMHLIFSLVTVLFHIVAYSYCKVISDLEQWKDDHPNEHHTLNGPKGIALCMQYFFSDSQLLYKLLLASWSFCGLQFDFLIFSLQLLDVCMQVDTLTKVFEAINQTWKQVFFTACLGFSIQYCFLVIGFLIFPSGYGFADMDTSGCGSLLDCFLAHMDYGFRSGPVWSGPELTWMQFFFDYMYNLVVILILAAIISGIIIDTFATLREEMNERKTDQCDKCFICGINKSQMERQMLKFEDHVFQQHYMWSYARFLFYLEEAQDCDLNGPESYVKDLVGKQDYGFYPIGHAMHLGTEDADSYEERELRVKDLQEFRGLMQVCVDGTDNVIQLERELKTALKDSRESVQDLQLRLGLLQADMQRRGIGESQSS